MPGPTHNRYYANTAFKGLTLAAPQRGIVCATDRVRSATVIAEKQHDRVVAQRLLVQCVEDLANGLIHAVYHRCVHWPGTVLLQEFG